MQDHSPSIIRILGIVIGVLVSYSGTLVLVTAALGRLDAVRYNKEHPSAANAEIAAEVHITNRLQFEPKEVHIETGQTVRWTNTSFDLHTVTADPNLAANRDDTFLPAGAVPFNSNLIQPNKTYTRTFSIPGRYRYFCIPHEASGMIGEVVVTR